MLSTRAIITCTNRIPVGWAVPTVSFLVGTAHPCMFNLFLLSSLGSVIPCVIDEEAVYGEDGFGTPSCALTHRKPGGPLLLEVTSFVTLLKAGVHSNWDICFTA